MSKNLYGLSVLACLFVATYTVPMQRVSTATETSEEAQATIDALQGEVRRGNIALIRDWLGEAGVYADTPGSDGLTLLLTAAISSRPATDFTDQYTHIVTAQREIAELLLHAGASPNACAPLNGNTPLHMAAWNGDYGLVDWLLQNRANRFVHNNNGRTALDIANEQADSLPYDPRNKRVAQYLVSH